MSKISIKIVDIHQPSNSVIVKFASENSAKPIDEYDGIAFQLTNFSSNNPEDFIKEITPYLSRLVAARDKSEQPRADIELASWTGFAVTTDTPVDFSAADQELPGLFNPEVVL
jgi:hypothetical protein